MSRPFSYSDENFTVIDNVLFVHVKYEENAPLDTKLCEIPKAIFDRLLFYSNGAVTCYHKIGMNGGDFQLAVIKDNNKFYFINKTGLEENIDRYIFSIYMLKDI